MLFPLLAANSCTCQRTVVHILGQSNACGRVSLPSGYTSDWTLRNGDVLTEDNSPHDIGGQWGLEMPLSNCFSDCETVLAKTCEGGISVARYINELLTSHIATASTVQNPTDGNCPNARNIAVWIQGEWEASRDPDYITYQSDEAVIFSALTESFPNIEIFSVLLNPSINRAFTSNVNADKAANAASFSNVTTIGPYALGSDNVHYGAAGFEAMATDLCALASS